MSSGPWLVMSWPVCSRGCCDMCQFLFCFVLLSCVCGYGVDFGPYGRFHFWGADIVFKNRFLNGFMFVYIYIYIYKIM